MGVSPHEARHIPAMLGCHVSRDPATRQNCEFTLTRLLRFRSCCWAARLWTDFDRLPYDILIPVFAFRRIGWTPDCMPDEARSQYDGLPDEGIRVFSRQGS